MSDGRFVVKPLDGKFAIEDLAWNELIRGWRKGLRNLIWRGDIEEAKSLCAQLNSGSLKPPREEMAKTQRIMYANRPSRKSVARAKAAAFSRCEGCGKMVKPGHSCPG